MPHATCQIAIVPCPPDRPPKTAFSGAPVQTATCHVPNSTPFSLDLWPGIPPFQTPPHREPQRPYRPIGLLGPGYTRTGAGAPPGLESSPAIGSVSRNQLSNALLTGACRPPPFGLVWRGRAARSDAARRFRQGPEACPPRPGPMASYSVSSILMLPCYLTDAAIPGQEKYAPSPMFWCLAFLASLRETQFFGF